MALDPATILRMVGTLDESEPIIRDKIENALMDVAGINRAKVADVINAGRALALEIAKLRIESFRRALGPLIDDEVIRRKVGRIVRNDTRRIYSAISIGLTSGEDNTDIAHRVIGSRRLNGSNGVTEITRQQLRMLLVD